MNKTLQSVVSLSILPQIQQQPQQPQRMQSISNLVSKNKENVVDKPRTSRAREALCNITNNNKESNNKEKQGKGSQGGVAVAPAPAAAAAAAAAAATAATAATAAAVAAVTTNGMVKANNSKREKSKSSKILTKRSAAVLADTTTNSSLAVVEAGGDAKKRKSDPMLIDTTGEMVESGGRGRGAAAGVGSVFVTVQTTATLVSSTSVVSVGIPSEPPPSTVVMISVPPPPPVLLLPPPLPLPHSSPQPTPEVVAIVQEWEDIDLNDFDDPQALTEYVNEIYQYLMEKEKKDRINPNYISVIQHDITEKMRSILVDWLIEVHRMFKLLPETLFLSINLIDRYLQQRTVTRDKLQLVGITSMLVASKYEEIYAPECNDFVYISDGAYTKDQILSTEQTLLNVLSFELTHTSPLHFLRRYSKAAASDYTIHTLCKYIIESMLIDVKMLKYTPSQQAAGSVYIARAMTGRQPLWTPTLQHYSGYTDEEVRVVAVEMNDLLKRTKTSSLKALRKKYSTPKYGQVADIALVDL